MERKFVLYWIRDKKSAVPSTTTQNGRKITSEVWEAAKTEINGKDWYHEWNRKSLTIFFLLMLENGRVKKEEKIYIFEWLGKRCIHILYIFFFLFMNIDKKKSDLWRLSYIDFMNWILKSKRNEVKAFYYQFLHTSDDLIEEMRKININLSLSLKNKIFCYGILSCLLLYDTFLGLMGCLKRLFWFLTNWYWKIC